MANNNLDLTSLDFTSLKESFKDFMKSQEIFSDYDFDGSNISVLLDVLAYNTQLNAWFLNQVASEAFLDTARTDSAIMSHAKELNYVPRSTRSAKAVIDMKVTQNGDDVLVIPKGTPFTTTVNGETLTFYTDETATYYANLSLSSGNTYVFQTGNVSIYEGAYVTDTYVFNDDDEDQEFLLSNRDVDTRSLTITVIEDLGATVMSYVESTTLLGVGPSSKVFFLQPHHHKMYEVVFGDNTTGRRPKNMAVINALYRISTGVAGNGASLFTIDKDVTSDSSGRIEITTVTIADGGQEAESLKSIKFNAPRHFQVQERAITESDYEVLLRAQFPEINTLSVYGGESASPPQYGKVFVAVDISEVDGLPESKKQEYYNFLKPRCSLSIEPVFVEPTYLYYQVSTKVKYNLNVSNLKTGDIKTLVTSAILTFNDENLDDFNKTLRYSRLTTAIDDADESIISNETEVQVYKKVDVQLGGKPQNIEINFGVPFNTEAQSPTLTHSSNKYAAVKSSQFILNGERMKLEDDGVGGIMLVKVSGNTHTKVKKVGSVIYAKGIVKVSNLSIDSDSIDGAAFKIYAIPATKDVIGSRSDIFTIESDEIKITVETVRE